MHEGHQFTNTCLIIPKCSTYNAKGQFAMSQGDLAKRTELRWINALSIIPMLAKTACLASLIDAST